MDICEHCHNVLAKSLDRCTVCGTLRADPFAGDVRRRDSGDAPAHAPGWAPPPIVPPGAEEPDGGLHADEFLRELIGDESPDAEAPSAPPASSAAPTTGALAGYLGTTVDRAVESPASDRLDAPPPPAPAPPTPASPPPAPTATTNGETTPSSGRPLPNHHLTTATKLTADGVAARSTRLDGSVKIGPTENHVLLTLGVPVLAGVVLVAAVLLSYRVRTSDAAAETAVEQASTIDAAAVTQSSSAVVRLDLDGCGVVDQTTGFLFADQAILVPRSQVKTDDRPTAVLSDGITLPAEIVGWSLTRDLAVVRADQRLSGGLRWGVSNRTSVGDRVSVLAVTGPGSAAPVPATVADVDTTNGIVSGFALDTSAEQGSVVLNGDGFVIGIIGESGTAQVSDDLSPAVSRIVLANERPPAECPPPPPTTVPDATDGDAQDQPANDSETFD